jgi:hypothetical protein
MDNAYVSVSYNKDTWQYYAEIVVGTKVKDDKYLTAHEAEGLDSYLQFLHEGKELIDIPVAELWEQIQDGDILLDDDSNLYLMLEELV